jgi:hypothetical protein
MPSLNAFTDSANALRRIRVSAHFVGINKALGDAMVDANTVAFEHIWPGAITETAYGLKRETKFTFF